MTDTLPPLVMYTLMGITFGLAGGLSPGPLTALLIRQTMNQGFRAGAVVAAVPIITDIPMLIIFCSGVGTVVKNPIASDMLTLIGAIFLFYLAIETWRSSGQSLVDSAGEGEGTFWRALLTNLLNPHPYVFWGTIGAPTTVKALSDGTAPMLGFVVSFFAALAGSKLIIAAGIARYQHILRTRVYRPLMRGLALALCGFGVILVAELLRSQSGS